MSSYNPPRKHNRFEPGSSKPFRLSRTRIELFIRCPRCFYVDRRLGIDRPSGPPFSLNSAVDTLLKKEFDVHRAAGTPHPLMKAYGIDAVPFSHEKMDDWRDSLRKGVVHTHEATNLHITGGVDDIWEKPSGELIVVDYKATSTAKEISLDDEWKQSYKRQMEIYQWLLRRNGFKVSDTGYFVYCNGNADREAFDGRLEFEVKIIPYTGSDGWVEKAIADAYACLMADAPPKSSDECEYCRYTAAVDKYVR